MPVEFHAELKTLRLTEPFRIAHGESFERQVVRVSARREGIEAIGEAPFVPYYGDNPAETLSWLRELPNPLVENPRHGPRVALLALDLLRIDMLGKATGKPYGQLWQQLSGSNWPAPPPGCRSFSIPGDLDEFAEKVRETSRQFSVLKLKLGSGNLDQDELMVIRARNAAPVATIFADANGGWSVDEAAAIIPQLKRWNISFIEQPIHHQLGAAGWRELRSKLPSRLMPLYADESAQTMDDVPQLARLADGINVKLLKCGGWHRAREMILAARVHQMKVILGCMIESSIGTTAAAHLAPLADWIDLDGHLYVANDDYEGIRYEEHGRLVMPDAPGIGVSRREMTNDE